MSLKFYYKLENESVDDSAEIKLPNFTKFLLTPTEVFCSRIKVSKGRESIPFSSPGTSSNSSSLLDLFTPLSLTPLSPRSISPGASYESGTETIEETEKCSFFGVNSEGIGLCSLSSASQHVEQFAIPLPKTHLKQFKLFTDAKVCLMNTFSIQIGNRLFNCFVTLPRV